MNFTKEFLEKTKEWLGEDGIKFFKEWKERHGVDWAIAVEPPKGKFPIPHPIHFREGMKIRNYMRQSGYFNDWDDHDFDNNWDLLIDKVLEL